MELPAPRPAGTCLLPPVFCAPPTLAPLIDEGTATRGRRATEGGDEHEGVRQLKPPWRPNVLNRNAVVNDAIKDAHTPR
jgi:hypothetical protein